MNDYKTNKAEQLSAWWQSDLGVTVLTQEQRVIQSMVNHFYGYYQLQLGANKCLLPLLTHAQVQKMIGSAGDVQAEGEAMPFKCYSIDTLLLSPVLEFADDPHQILRESERILVSDGTLILSYFNRWSLLGLKRLFSWQDNPPWNGSFFSQARVKDWLSLLNFDVIETKRFMYRPPFQSDKNLARFHFLERWGQRLWSIGSGVTILVATKRTIPLTLNTQQRRAKRLFPAGRRFAKTSVQRNQNG